MTGLIADIAVNAPLKQLFSYTVPDALDGTVQVGMRVRVQFGRRLTVGTVLGLRHGTGDGLKPLEELLDAEPLLSTGLIKLLRWAADYYCHPIGQVVKTALPADIGGDKARTGILTEAYFSCREPSPARPRGKKQQALLEFIASRGTVGLSLIREHFSAPQPTLKKLVAAGYLRQSQGERIRDPFRRELPTADCPPHLTQAQQTSLERLDPALAESRFASFLLHGVTGSGKTEVYLRAVKQCLDQGRQALVLVPEISLTPQLVGRFRARFCSTATRIAVLHSGLSAGERYDAWREIVRGGIQIVIGARSAIFAPLPNLGLIVVDEEHDSSYKQAEGFRYHARDLALVRGQQQSCPVLLGSATPSFSTYYRTGIQASTRLVLDQRVHAGELPRVELIDLRRLALSGSLSEPLLNAIRAALERREQVLLLLNRRGYAPFLLCADCGQSFYCPNCSITLTFHRQARQLHCHYCDHRVGVPEICPHCRSLNLLAQGAGTEKLLEELTQLFPDARIARMDRDTTTRKGAHEKIIQEMLARRIDILVGTQMVAKGHDFPGVSLVGVIDADSLLNFPDFRCAERGFALLTQVAGRAGRAGGGEVKIQTYNPDHYALTSVVSQDYQQFYGQELPFREELGYPPCGHLVNLVLAGHDAALVEKSAIRTAAELRRNRGAVEVLGPTPCPLARLRGKSRYQVLLKSRERRNLRRLLGRLDLILETLPGQVSPQIDVDPLNML